LPKFHNRPTDLQIASIKFYEIPDSNGQYKGPIQFLVFFTLKINRDSVEKRYRPLINFYLPGNISFLDRISLIQVS